MNRKTVLSNIIWKYLERIGAQGVSFVVSIVLARLLSPEVFGYVALISVIITILQVLVDSGFSGALIQKKNADDLDFSTIFFFNLFVSILLYIGAFFCAPIIAEFYGNAELVPQIRVLCILILIYGVKSVQQAYVCRTMQFKKFFFATLGGTLGSGVVGIILAYNGFGIWALIFQNLLNYLTDTIILWITVKWRPKKMISFQRLKSLFSFGWKLLVSSLIDTIYNNVRPLIIGKYYTSSDLAYYNRGKSWPELIVVNLNSSLSSVLFPAYSKYQDDKQQLMQMVRKTMKTSTYLIAPLLAGLFAVAEPMVRLLLTEKWLPCVAFLRIFCITFVFYPLHTANLSAINALGRSDIFLKLEIIKKIIGIVALAVTIPISVMAMGYSLLFTSLASQIINSWPNKKLLNYSYLQQLKDILPGILLAVAMGCCIYPIQWLGLPDIVTLCIQVPLGVAIYIAGSKLFKLESFEYLWNILKPVLSRIFKRKKG